MGYEHLQVVFLVGVPVVCIRFDLRIWPVSGIELGKYDHAPAYATCCVTPACQLLHMCPQWLQLLPSPAAFT